MAPSAPHIAAQLRHLIYYDLDNNLLKNALFLAQRLVAYESRSAEAAFLLAHCQYQSGFVKAAYDTARPCGSRGSHLGCAYVFAQACLELGRFVDGLSALDKSKVLWQNRSTWNQHSETRRQHLPDAAAVLCLKGKLWKAHKNLDQAVDSWAQSLRLNPFMWDAFDGLCEAGARVSLPNIYKLSPEMEAIAKQAHAQSSRADNAAAPVADKPSATSLPLQAQATNLNQTSGDPFMSTSKTTGHGSTALWEKLNGSKVSVNTLASSIEEDGTATPSTIADPDDGVLHGGPVSGIYEAPPAPIRKAKSANEVSAEPGSRFKPSITRARAKAKGGSDEASILPDPAPPAAPSKRTISGHVANSAASQINGAEGTRRSNRLLNTSRPPSANGATSSKLSSFTNSLGLREGRDIKKARAPTIKGRTATASTVGRVVSGNRTRTGSSDEVDGREKTIPPVPSIANHKVRTEPQPQLPNKHLEALEALFDLHNKMGTAQMALSNYDCHVAIQVYNSLPSTQRETPYILAQIGKSYYEQASYADAEKFFVRVRQLAPSRLEDMEVYSTCLWHLKSDIELAFLAHELMAIDRLSPQAWVAVGNSFSLQREHEQALRCFKRATQLDPGFAYGFTLQGHEYVANEEFEKALDAYRAAIAADSRHYNAWYGLGKVYEKMGKWSIAEQHYRTAARINPTNAVLICCIGVVLERLKKPVEALAMYSRACSLSPNSALSRFKKARCLMMLNKPREALSELKILQDVAPDEANVWFLMGRLYKMLRSKGDAVRAFTMALNLDPKAAQYIKDAMESLDDDDDGLDEDEDMD